MTPQEVADASYHFLDPTLRNSLSLDKKLALPWTDMVRNLRSKFRINADALRVSLLDGSSCVQGAAEEADTYAGRFE